MKFDHSSVSNICYDLIDLFPLMPHYIHIQYESYVLLKNVILKKVQNKELNGTLKVKCAYYPVKTRPMHCIFAQTVAQEPLSVSIFSTQMARAPITR